MIDQIVSEILNAHDKGMPPLNEYTQNAAKWYHKEAIDALIDINPRGKVLDLGCGYGAMSLAAAKLGCDVVAVDYYYPYIPWKIREAYGIELIVKNLESETLDDDLKYDCVMAVEVIEHIANAPWLINNIFNTLKHGGKLLISTPNGEVWKLEDTLQADTDAYSINPYHSKHYTMEELEKMLYRFSIEKKYTHRDDKHIIIVAEK